MIASPEGGKRRVAVVTGGTSGIGRAVTLGFVREAYHVVAIGNDADQSAETKASLAKEGLACMTLEGDVSAQADVSRLVTTILERFGHIDVLCNNAAIRPVGTILETDEATWDRTFLVNVKSTYLFTRAVLPTMIARRGGAIINTGSPSGYGGRGHIAYCASKGAIFAFTKSLAIDHLRDGIRVNAIVPGFTLTPMTEHFTEERKGAAIAMNVAGRMRTPADIASVVCFLASDAAATVSGATWEVGVFEGQMVLAKD